MIGAAFAAVDGLLSPLPVLARLVVWAIIAAAVSMAAYRLTSPQEALQRIRRRRAEVQGELKAYDGAIADAYPLLGESLRLAFAQLLRVLLPTAVAALPILALLYWLDMTYGYRFPAGGEAIVARADPPTVAAELVKQSEEAGWSLAVATADGARLELPLPEPVPLVHERRWWNAIIGNPAGYLPEGWPVELVEIDLPQRDYLSAGPGWLRPWYVPFLAALFAASLTIKIGFRIV